MIGKDENNQIHQLTSSFNPRVVDVVALAKLTDTRNFIDMLSGAKEDVVSDIRRDNERRRIQKRAGELNEEIGVREGEER